MSSASAKDHYQAGRLREAIAAATDEVRTRPTDVPARRFLCELLCLAGDLDRAGRQLEAVAQQSPDAVLAVGQFLQLVRAEQARRELFSAGRPPELLDAPPPRLRLHLEAAARAREGQPGEAARLLAEAEALCPSLKGTCDGKPFEGLRDLDDLTSSFFEVLSTDGKYYWVPMERVAAIEFQAPQGVRDLLWRQALLTVRDGPDGEVFLPALYPGTHAEADDSLRLGRSTEWRGAEGQPVCGAGQRVLLIGDDDRPFLELKALAIE
jgi:type VI secretion system protein ImpE